MPSPFLCHSTPPLSAPRLSFPRRRLSLLVRLSTLSVWLRLDPRMHALLAACSSSMNLPPTQLPSLALARLSFAQAHKSTPPPPPLGPEIKKIKKTQGENENNGENTWFEPL